MHVNHFCFFLRLYKANGFGKPFGPKSQVGDRIGCGIKFPKPSADQENQAAQNMAKVFFTHNGKEVKCCLSNEIIIDNPVILNRSSNIKPKYLPRYIVFSLYMNM